MRVLGNAISAGQLDLTNMAKILLGCLFFVALLMGLTSEAGIFYFHRLLGRRVLTVTVDPVYPTHGANWNSYVRRVNSGGSWTDNNQTIPETACTGAESGRYEACIHGGEKKRVTLTGYTSCSNITASDTLDVFDWECQLVGGVATVFSQRLKPARRLADLVNPTSWKQNSINVYQSGNLIARSNAAAWWTNTVQAPAANPLSTDGTVTLSSAGTIYVVNSNTTTSGYYIAADQISFVVMPGFTLSSSGRTTANTNFWGGCTPASTHWALLFSGSQKFLWFEGRYNGNFGGNPAGGTFGFCSTRFSVFRNLNLLASGVGETQSAIDLFDSGANIFTNIIVEQYGGNWAGIYEQNSSFNRWRNITINGNTVGTNDVAFTVSGASSFYTELNVPGHRGGAIYIRAINATNLSESVITNVMAAGAFDTGLSFYQCSRNTVHQVTSNNHGQKGILVQDTNYNTLNNIVAVNNGDSSVGGMGIFLQNSDFTKISHAALAHNTASFAWGLYAETNSNSAVLQNQILVGNNTTDCQADNGTAGFTSACANQGSSTATYRTGRNLTNSFVGKVTSNDVANQSDSSGTQSYGSITDWFRFDNRYRGWGRDGSAFPNMDHRGPCTTGTCRIWDWRLRSTDTVIRNTSNDGSTQNAAFVAGSACPAAVGGSYTIVDQLTVANTFLVNALEIVGDYSGGLMVGDDDGLCESNEACIYSPNFGAYQGEGDYLSNGTCTFSSGTVSNVIMYAYPTNGG